MFITDHFSRLGKVMSAPAVPLAPLIAHRKIGKTYRKVGASEAFVWGNGKWPGSKCRLHPKVRADACKVCRGSEICIHQKRKNCCRECGPQYFCTHGRRSACKECYPVGKKLDSGAWCVGCLSARLSPRRIAAKTMVCAKCDKSTPPRVEQVVYDAMCSVWLEGTPDSPMPTPSIKDNQLIGCGSSKRRPDMCWAYTDRIVHVEVDEHSHRGRDPSCEVAKVDETNFGLAGDHVPTLFLRFNPDSSDFMGGIKTLVKHLREALTVHDFVSGLSLCETRANVRFICYGSNGQKHIDAAKVLTDSMVVVGRV
jgi:hypothetical protein